MRSNLKDKNLFNRRKYFRFALTYPMEIISRVVSITNISEEGIGFSSPCKLDKQEYQCAISYQKFFWEDKIFLDMRIIWERYDPIKEQYYYGGYFIGKDNNKKIQFREAVFYIYKRNNNYDNDLFIEKNDIVSEEIKYLNRYGKKIIGFYDHNSKSVAPIVENIILIPPAYGETKRDALMVSYYLVKNGFAVIRYDATDHIGESEGNVSDISMETMKNDIIDSLDFIKQNFYSVNIGIVASSVSFRAALKAASQSDKINCLIGLVGVVDLQNTLFSVYQEDIIYNINNGIEQESYDMLGYLVKKDYFVSAVKDNYHTLETTKLDLKRINIPVILLSAEKDVWVDVDQVMSLASFFPSKIEVCIIPNAMHQLFENPAAAQHAMKKVVALFYKYLKNVNYNIEKIKQPNIRQVAQQNKIEKERLKLLREFTLDNEKEFWSNYTLDFAMIKKVGDYREYLDLIINLLGEYKKGDFFLDAGCGVGYVGVWLAQYLNSKKIEDRMGSNYFLYYHGVDFISDNIKRSKRAHQATKQLILQERYSNLIKFTYEELDLNNRLPYASCTFDKICCSLVISYLNNPVFSVKELLRVLKFGGKLIISSLKPHNDLSQIYRNFLATAKSKEDIVKIKRLLSSAGQIKQKEGEGYYNFFSEDDFKKMLGTIGVCNAKIYRSFGNQANVVLCEK